MVKIQMRYVRQKGPAFYFQPTKAMRKAGFAPEPLGRDPAAAYARATALVNEWDVIRKKGDPNAKPPKRPGTVEHLIEKLRGTNEWKRKSQGRKDNLESSFKIIAAAGFGKALARAVTTDNCEDFYQGLEAKYGPHRCHDVYRDLRYLFNYMIRSKYGQVTFNPTYIVKIATPKARRQKWSTDQVMAAIDKGWEAGYHGAAVGLALMYDTSMRPGDTRRLPPEEIDLQGRRIMIPAQGKTGNPHWTTLWPETVALVRRYYVKRGAVPMTGQPILRTRTGRRFTKLQFARDIRTIMDLAGIPKDVQARDLRRTAQYERATSGATAMEAGAAAGQKVTSSQDIIDTYVPPDYELAKRAQVKRGRKLKPRTKGGRG